MSWVSKATKTMIHESDSRKRQEWLEGLMVGDVVARTVQLSAEIPKGWGKSHLYIKEFELHMVVTKTLKTQIVCDRKHRYVKTGCSCAHGYGDTRGSVHPTTRKDARADFEEYYETLASYMNRLHLMRKLEFTAHNFPTVEILKEAVHEMEGHAVRMRAIVVKGEQK
ncbi:hypothetical protein [Vibrio phage vB_VpS_PG28]|nr:hypothetical protein [Vibrio phage vB_VpS_PG28]